MHIDIFIDMLTPNSFNKNQELSHAYRVSCKTNKEQQQQQQLFDFELTQFCCIMLLQLLHFINETCA